MSWSCRVRGPTDRLLRHKPELLPEVGPQVLGQLVAVLQAGQQEATALEQQDSLSRTQNELLQV